MQMPIPSSTVFESVKEACIRAQHALLKGDVANGATVIIELDSHEWACFITDSPQETFYFNTLKICEETGQPYCRFFNVVITRKSRRDPIYV